MINIRKDGRYHEIAKFIITGGICFVVDYVTMTVLVELLQLHYLIGSACGFTVSVILNYLLCRCWVFDGSNNQTRKSMVLFIGSSVIGLLLNQFFMYVFVGLLNIYYLFAKVIATLLVMIWNYIMKRKALKN